MREAARTGGLERSLGPGTMTHIQMFLCLVLLHALAEPSFEKQNGQRYKVNPNDAKRGKINLKALSKISSLEACPSPEVIVNQQNGGTIW